VNLRQRLREVTGESLALEGGADTCRVCGQSGPVAFYEANAVPSQTCVLLDTLDEAADYPSGDMLLVFCERCGFIQNSRFDPALVDYSVPTEESQAFSPTFTEFAAALANELVARYDLVGKSVLEVGCGKGDFLRLLAERGISSGRGIDPGYLPNRIVGPGLELEFTRDWFGPGHTHLTADLVLTRHLMEHVSNVSEFLGWLRESVLATPGAALFTEVPDVGRVLAEGAFWDVYYEHCSYFTAGSLERALNRAGFDVDWLRMGFGDQYLLAGAVPTGGATGRVSGGPDIDGLAVLVEDFAHLAADRLSFWRDRITAEIGGGGRVVVWGGGSKAVAFLTSLGVSDVLVVDINPYKQGRWLPGLAVEVQPPDILRDLPPSLVIPMNSAYSSEIRHDLREMGLDPVLIPVQPE
jgi:SAM-dependent methyltransferase